MFTHPFFWIPADISPCASDIDVFRYNGYGKQVTPAFSQNPVLKKVEKLKKLSDAEEAAERKKAMDNAIAAKTNGPKSANVKSQDNEYNEEGGSKPLFGRVRSEEEIFDSFMDFKIKKSGWYNFA